MAFDPDFKSVDQIWKSEAFRTGELARMTRHAMHRLTVKQAQALTLVAVGGMTAGQAAAVCGCAEKTMQSRVACATKSLGDLLAQAGGPIPHRLSPTARGFIIVEALRAFNASGRRGIYKF